MVLLVIPFSRDTSHCQTIPVLAYPSKGERPTVWFDPASSFVLHSRHMRQVVGGVAAFAFTALFVQSPWAHVHTGAATIPITTSSSTSS